MTGERPFDHPLDRPVAEGLPSDFLARFSEAGGAHAPGGPTMEPPLFDDLSDPVAAYHDPAHTEAVIVLGGGTGSSAPTESLTDPDSQPYADILPGDAWEEPTAPLRRPSAGRGSVRARFAGATGLYLAGTEFHETPGRRGGKIHRRRRPSFPDPTAPDNDGTPLSNHEEQGEQ